MAYPLVVGEAKGSNLGPTPHPKLKTLKIVPTAAIDKQAQLSTITQLGLPDKGRAIKSLG